VGAELRKARRVYNMCPLAFLLDLQSHKKHVSFFSLFLLFYIRISLGNVLTVVWQYGTLTFEIVSFWAVFQILMDLQLMVLAL